MNFSLHLSFERFVPSCGRAARLSPGKTQGPACQNSATIDGRAFNSVRQQRVSRLAGIAMLACFLIWGISSPAVEAADWKVENVRVGWENQFKVGVWTPVEFDVVGPAQGGVISPVLITSDPDGQGTRIPFSSITVNSSEPVRVQGLFRSGRLESSVQIQLEQDQKILVNISQPVGRNSPVKAVRQSTQVWMTVGDHPPFLAAAERWNQLVPGGVQLIRCDQLDDSIFSSESLDGVDLIVMNADRAVSEVAADSIKSWVRRGGRLVICVGDGVEALSQNPLSQWLPIQPTGQTEVRNLSGFNEAVRGSSTLRLLRGGLPAAELDARQGQSIIRSLNSPLAVRAAYGIGKVTMVAVKTDQRPLSAWESDSLSQFAMLLSGLEAPWDDPSLIQDRRMAAAELAPSGISDIETQLVHSVDRFPEVQRPSHWVVMGWIALFAVIVGPIEYFLLNRYWRRPEWTWLTLPVWIGLASWYAIAQAETVNDHSVTPRQLDLTDIDIAEGVMRTHSWYAFYSPENQRNALSAEPVSLNGAQGVTSRLITSWVGRPEASFRGMYRSGGRDDAKPSYQFSESLASIDDFPSRVWSSAMMDTRWEQEIDAKVLADSDLTETVDGRLMGSVTHHLPGEIEDWILAYGSFAYFPFDGIEANQAPLKPDVPLKLQVGGSRILRNELIGRSQRALQQENIKIQIQIARNEYDRTSLDSLAVARMLTFFEHTGGQTYTGLTNEGLTNSDLSELLTLNRAILFGRLKSPVTKIEHNGQATQPEGETFVRFILPVKRSGTERTVPAESAQPSLLQ